MPDIAAANVTYTELPGTIKGSPSDPRSCRTFSVAFGNGSLTYPTGGVPLDKGKLGCPTIIEKMLVIDPSSANGFLYKYDLSNNKVRVFQGDNDGVADGALVELAGGVATPALATLKVEVTGY